MVFTDFKKTIFEASALSSSVTMVIPASSPKVDHILPLLDAPAAVALIEGLLEGAKDERRLGVLDAFGLTIVPLAETDEVGFAVPDLEEVKLFALGRSPNTAEAIDPLDVAPRSWLN